MDKAGAYAAQGIGMSFVDSYEGSYANVVGLPLPQVIDCFLDNFGQKALEENFPCFRKT
jgi:septum formation protein